jgi:hypothetical protein
MTEKDTETGPPKSTRRLGRLAIGVLATVLLGAIGSGLWDILFKPGISRFGAYITGLSREIDNAVFTTAALDPLPVSSLVVLLLITAIPLIGAMFFVDRAYIRGPLHAFLDRRLGRKPDEPLQSNLIRVRKVRRIVAFLGIGMCLIVYVAASTAFAVINEAVIVWRAFYRNIEICAPYVPQEQILSLRASFRMMNTRDDFMAIRSAVDTIATSHDVVLEWYEPRK